MSCRSTGDQETSHTRPFRRRDTSFHQRSQPQAAKRWQAFWQNAELSVEFASEGYEEYAQNKRLSAQDARTRLVAESSSSAKTVTISQAVASYEANFTMAVSVSNKTQ